LVEPTFNAAIHHLESYRFASPTWRNFSCEHSNRCAGIVPNNSGLGGSRRIVSVDRRLAPAIWRKNGTISNQSWQPV
jgi:hypothetical protein